MSWRQLWQQFRKNRAAEIGLYLLVGFVVTAVLAYLFSPYDPFALGDETLLAPGADHWMGTDDLGRDTLSRVIHGARVPLLVGFLATATSLALGILIGSLSGYFGGRTDTVLMRATEYVLVVPRFFLALLVVAMLGTGIMKIVLVRSQSDQLGIAIKRSSGTDQRFGLAGDLSRIGDISARTLRQSFWRRHQRCAQSEAEKE